MTLAMRSLPLPRKMKKSLLALALGGLSIGTTEFIMMGLLPDVAKDFDITIPQAGHFISIYALGVVIGAPLLVLLGSKFAPKRILVALMAIFTIFNGLTALSNNYHLMLFARLMSGLPHGAFFGVGAVVASRLAVKGKEARAVAIMFAGLTIANIAMVPAGTYIGHHYSWKYSFGIITVLGLLTMLSILLWMPDIKAEQKQEDDAGLSFFKTLPAWVIILITSIGTGGLFSWISYIAPFMTEVSKFEPEQVSYILILSGVGMLFGNFIGGRLADSFPAVKAILISFGSIVTCLLLGYLLAPYQLPTLIMTFMIGAATFTLVGPIQMLMIKSAKGAEMLGAAATQAAFNTGNALGAYLGGIPITLGFSFASPILVGIIMACAGIGLTIYFRKIQRGVVL